MPSERFVKVGGQYLNNLEISFVFGETLPTEDESGARFVPLTTVSGTNGIYTPTSGQTFDRVFFDCKLELAGLNNLTFNDCTMVGPPSAGGPNLFGAPANGDNTIISMQSNACNNIVFNFCTVIPQTPSQYWHGLKGRGFRMVRCLVKHVVDCVQVNQTGSQPVTLEGCWFDRLGYFSPCTYQNDDRTHNDTVQIVAGSGLVTIFGCALYGRASVEIGDAQSTTVPATLPASYFPSVTGQGLGITPTSGTVSNILVQKSWFGWGAQSVTVINGTGLGANISIQTSRFDTRTNPNLTKNSVQARRAILVDTAVTALANIPATTGPDQLGNTNWDASVLTLHRGTA